MNTNRRIGLTISATMLAAAGTIIAGSPTATAADIPNYTFSASKDSDGSLRVGAYLDGRYAGLAEWSADPIPHASYPGDAVRALDVLADGWGAEAIIENPYRIATTQGHSSPYTTSWKTGDLAEGREIRMRLCMVKGLNAKCSKYYAGNA
ncbi:hypothetical protein [Streptomyces anulatus]|uniref:hypothetical protein n=1 Tax=Streptomyces anulatus TaxID=1892 RepID=UPI00386DDDDC|nr:hypothetical protein OG865_24830 [Streptomyces anulatus]